MRATRGQKALSACEDWTFEGACAATVGDRGDTVPAGATVEVYLEGLASRGVTQTEGPKADPALQITAISGQGHNRPTMFL